MWVRMNDRHRVPLRLGCKASQKAISFLCDFGAYMHGLADKGMPRDTCMDVYHTCRGLTGLAEYLLTRHAEDVDYVLLGKVQ